MSVSMETDWPNKTSGATERQQKLLMHYEISYKHNLQNVRQLYRTYLQWLTHQGTVRKKCTQKHQQLMCIASSMYNVHGQGL